MTEISIDRKDLQVSKPKKKKGSAPLDDDGKKTRLRHTNYFLTINTNQVFHERSEEAEGQKESLRTAIRKIFNEKFIDSYIDLHPNAPKGSKINELWIKCDETEIIWALEVGETSKRLHAHVAVLIPHYTLLKVKEQDLKIDLDKAMEEVGYSNYYFKPIYGREAGCGKDQLKAYIMKNPIN